MKEFMDDNFILGNDTAKHLFHDYAKDLPIIDYHCHLSPQQIAENIQFRDITQLRRGPMNLRDSGDLPIL